VQQLASIPKLQTTTEAPASAYSRLGKYGPAIQDYGQGINLRPKELDVYHYLRGKAYSDKRDYDHAIKDYDQAIVFDLKYAAAYNDRGDAFYYKEDCDAAIRDYKKTIELDVGNATAFERSAGHISPSTTSSVRFRNTIRRSPCNRGTPMAGRPVRWRKIYPGRIEPAIADLAAAVKSQGDGYDAICLHMARMDGSPPRSCRPG
jgi:tetratricopeptide (TPR) repeat protein